VKIRNGRLYVLETIPGISGFKRWDEREHRVVTAAKARLNRSNVAGELLPIAEDFYRLEDGHLPDHQPMVRFPEAEAWLIANPFSAIVRLDPATRSKAIPPHWVEA
jgi:hypothetical protein